jgi:hypothetical protein
MIVLVKGKRLKYIEGVKFTQGNVEKGKRGEVDDEGMKDMEMLGNCFVCQWRHNATAPPKVERGRNNNQSKLECYSYSTPPAVRTVNPAP